ncbi:MAG: GNAT family N-acetyltransferase [Acidobacteria bacterium]|nr:GNAT family N-acetyltransferase [Acidobacteriota bacterium]
MQIDFRQILPDDFEFLWRLHNAALKIYVEKTWGWNEDWQRANFKNTFNPSNGEIIVACGADAGFLRIIEKETETLLASIRLSPEFQNKGIGTQIIKNLLAESEKPVKLQVLKVNPARALYERLGFEVVGETDTHFLMKTQGLKSKVSSRNAE